MNKNNDVKTAVKAEIIIANYRKTEGGHKTCVAKCPYCCNFFEAREDSIKSGLTKSCGCKKRGITPNVYYFPLNCDYVVGFYNNTNGYFIFDADKFDIISKYHWTDRNLENRHEPITTIDGKTISMAGLLVKPPVGLVVDHVNGIPNDNRIKNLRIATYQQNSMNTPAAKNTNQEEFEEFTYENSQKIAREIETYEFNDSFVFYGKTLEEINSLSEKNIYKRNLRNICREMCRKGVDDEYETIRLLRLIDDYKKNKLA